MFREHTSETLHQDDVRDPCRTLCQASDADAPHSEDVVQGDACEDLLLISWVSHNLKVLTHVENDKSPANSKIPPSLAPCIALASRIVERFDRRGDKGGGRRVQKESRAVTRG